MIWLIYMIVYIKCNFKYYIFMLYMRKKIISNLFLFIVLKLNYLNININNYNICLF